MIQKLFMLAAVVAIAWYGFKIYERFEAQRKKKVAEDDSAGRERIADTVQCPVCKAFIVEDIKSDCGKSGCPY